MAPRNHATVPAPWRAVRPARQRAGVCARKVPAGEHRIAGWNFAHSIQEPPRSARNSFPSLVVAGRARRQGMSGLAFIVPSFVMVLGLTAAHVESLTLVLDGDDDV